MLSCGFYSAQLRSTWREGLPTFLYPGYASPENFPLQAVLGSLFRNTRTTDSLRPAGKGEFLARSSRACAACALLATSRHRARRNVEGRRT